LFLCALALSACASLDTPIHVNDDEFCTDLGKYGAECRRTLSNRQRSLDKAAWDKERGGQLCTKSQTIEHLVSTVLKACTELKCTYDEIETIKSAARKLKSMKQKSISLLQPISQEVENEAIR